MQRRKLLQGVQTYDVRIGFIGASTQAALDIVFRLDLDPSQTQEVNRRCELKRKFIVGV
jgi:hypothetical protein